jgi:hypothetical protein
VCESMSAAGGNGTRLKARKGRGTCGPCMHTSVPHIRGERRGYALDVKTRITPAAVALVAPRDASQHGVILVVGRDPRGGTSAWMRVRVCLRSRTAPSPSPGTPGMSACHASASRKRPAAAHAARAASSVRIEKTVLDVDVYGAEVRESSRSTQ